MTFHGLSDLKVCIIGLGYVGLPLAVEFSKRFKTIGFDINERRVSELRAGHDTTLETEDTELQSCPLTYSTNLEEIKSSNFYIVTVPTPIDEFKRPDLNPLKSASQTVAQVISKGDCVVFESTVYPGATEEDCIPIIEELSGLKLNQDFYAGYSPERINPGDKEHRVSSILKVTSGSTKEAGEYVNSVYAQVIDAGTYLASSIRVAEAAKVIENTQRDVNIALVNELSLIFERLGIDTEEVLLAAGTKWNFLPFRPGLVGGHCIGVDPYYLTHKAQEIGYHPEIVLSGRRINDSMGPYVAGRIIKLLTKNKVHVVDSNILVMGFAFKENCPDLRNTRVVDVVKELKSYHANVDVYDPWVSKADAKQEYDLELIDSPEQGKYDAIILAVAHNQFKEMGGKAIRKLGSDKVILFDVKYCLEREFVSERL